MWIATEGSYTKRSMASENMKTSPVSAPVSTLPPELGHKKTLWILLGVFIVALLCGGAGAAWYVLYEISEVEPQTETPVFPVIPMPIPSDNTPPTQVLPPAANQ